LSAFRLCCLQPRSPSVGPLGRHPLGGRNWEGFSPDPYLSGVAVAATIRGVQDAGVQACTKHYIANEQETQRSNTTLADGTHVNAISSNVDDRTLHELYLWPFANAVKAGTSSIMCSYQRFNQTYSCENDYLLNEVLKGELGFNGYVVSDWFATHSAAFAVNSGLDMEMPGDLGRGGAAYPGSSFFFGDLLKASIENGTVSITRLDDMIARIMTPYYLLSQNSSDFPTTDPTTTYVLMVTQFGLFEAKRMVRDLLGQEWQDINPRDVRADHGALIRKLGAEATVLLKNEGGILPLLRPKIIGVFGSGAGDMINGLMYRETTIAPALGTIPIGGGSGSGRFSYIVSPLEAIKTKSRQIGARVQYVANNTAIALNEISMYPTPDVCLLFLTGFASEGFDRPSMLADGNSTSIVQGITGICNNTVVIVNGPGVVAMPWADHTNVKAILTAHYPGQEIGNSIVDVLWGDSEPSGRLPYSIPKQEADYGVPVVSSPRGSGENGWQADFTEGQMIDYRDFDARNVTPRYEFGFGLTYTTFEISGLKVGNRVADPAAVPDPALKIEPGGNPDLWKEILVLETTVRNIGTVLGHTIPQLYMTFPSSTPKGTPLRVLRGFEKVQLSPGASHDIQFHLTRRDISYWDTTTKTWVIPRGDFEFRVGFSSRDLRVALRASILVG
jgi:beta-glucosidase